MELDINGLILDNAYVQSGTLCGDRSEFNIRNVMSEGGAVRLDSIVLVIDGFSSVRAELVSRKVLGVNNTVKQMKGRQLYKSELADFTARLTGEEWDIVSADLSRPGTVSFTLSFGDGGLFSFTAKCGGVSAFSRSPEERVFGNGRGFRKWMKAPRFPGIFSKNFAKQKH